MLQYALEDAAGIGPEPDDSDAEANINEGEEVGITGVGVNTPPPPPMFPPESKKKNLRRLHFWAGFIEEVLDDTGNKLTHLDLFIPPSWKECNVLKARHFT